MINNCYKNYIYSNNSSRKILKRYTYSIIVMLFFLIIYYLFNKNYNDIYLLLRGIIITSICINIIELIFKIIKKDNIYLYKNVIGISLLLGILTYKENIYLLILSSIITAIFLRFKRINFSSILYGLLIIELYRYFYGNLNDPFMYLRNISLIDRDYIFSNFGNYIDFLLGFKFNYISIILVVLLFLYLFIKKSIKYSIVFSYIGIILVMFFIVGLYSNINIMYVLLILCSGNIGLYCLFLLSDYYSTPILVEGGYIYGLIMGIISFCMYFIIDNLGIVVSFIIGSIFIYKYIDNISIKIISNYKLYNKLIIIIFILGIGISNLLGYLFK